LQQSIFTNIIAVLDAFKNIPKDAFKTIISALDARENLCPKEMKQKLSKNPLHQGNRSLQMTNSESAERHIQNRPTSGRLWFQKIDVHQRSKYIWQNCCCVICTRFGWRDHYCLPFCAATLVFIGGVLQLGGCPRLPFLDGEFFPNP